MKKAVVVGAGAGGATVAKELQGRFQVTVLEAGRDFTPFTGNIQTWSALRKTGLFFDERAIRLLFPAMRVRKSDRGMVFVNGMGPGGTTTMSAGNAFRVDGDLKALGINLDGEFDEIYREIPVSTSHQRRWHPVTRQLFGICGEMGLDPRPTPKMGDIEKCTRCGRCIFGCPRGAKWDAREYLSHAREKGAEVLESRVAERVEIRDHVADGVWARAGRRREFYRADLVVVAAGGFGTPALLENSGIECEPRLFVDPVLCLAGPREGVSCQNEISMPFFVQRDRYMLSPYFDYLSFFFNRAWRHPVNGIVSMMVKLADTPAGSVRGNTISAGLTAVDEARMNEGLELCREILRRLGVQESKMFLGTINAGHPGGMLPLTVKEAVSLHHDRLPENLYVADATLLPRSLGNPPILTIIALAKKISRLLVGAVAALALLLAGCKETTAPEEESPAASYLHIRASWSPDGRTIAYRDESSAKAGIWLVDSAGTTSRQLVSGEGIGLTWSPDSRWVAYSAVGSISMIRVNGDSLTRLTTGANDIRPAWSPDGSQIAFVRTGIWLVRLSSLEVRQLTVFGNFPSWHPNGDEVVVLDQELQPPGVQFQYYIDAIDTASSALRALFEFVTAASCGFGAISPDAKKYLLRAQAEKELAQVWVLDFDASTLTRLTTDGGDYPAWSPDGDKIVYTRTAVGDGGLWVMASDGGGKRRLTLP